MASKQIVTCRFESSNGRCGYRIRFRDRNGKRRAVWLGNATETLANRWRSHIEHLAQCARDAAPYCAHTSQWLANLSDYEQEKLAKVELVSPRAEPAEITSEPITLGSLCDNYIASRKAVVPRTRLKYEHTKSALTRYFGNSRAIDTITVADAESWREWLATEGNAKEKEDKQLANATVSKKSGIAKQIFAWAIRGELLIKNPFSGLPSRVGANEDLQEFVEKHTTELVIDKTKEIEWKTLIALARFGGLRIPSEIEQLTWGDIDFAASTMFIRSPKTKRYEGKASRLCPLFVTLRPYLERLAAIVKPGIETSLQSPVINIKSANLGTKFKRLVSRAKVPMWPKAWQNLRASCGTELLMQGFTQKEVSAWLGNSEVVLHEHYAMVTQMSFRRAAGITFDPSAPRGPVGGPNSVDSSPLGTTSDDVATSPDKPKGRKKTKKKPALSTPVFTGLVQAGFCQIGPEGLEQDEKSQAIRELSIVVGQLVGQMDAEGLRKLITILKQSEIPAG